MTCNFGNSITNYRKKNTDQQNLKAGKWNEDHSNDRHDDAPKNHKAKSGFCIDIFRIDIISSKKKYSGKKGGDRQKINNNICGSSLDLASQIYCPQDYSLL